MLVYVHTIKSPLVIFNMLVSNQVVLTLQGLVYVVANTKDHPKRLEVSTLLGNFHQSENPQYLVDAYHLITEQNHPIALICSPMSIINLN